jgi:hypothetical protein
MHWCVLWLQHPPFWQTEPSQHGSPEPPHEAHPCPCCGSHAVSDCVQKALAFPVPLGLPGQQARPSEPHVPEVPPMHRPWPQTPSVEPHELPVPMQRPPTQHRPCPHALRAQQGCVVPPQLTIAPLLQTCPPFGPSPLARQEPLLQQPPPAHALPVQQDWPGCPHARQVPAVQTLPAAHRLPAQQAEPTVPQMVASASATP